MSRVVQGTRIKVHISTSFAIPLISMIVAVRMLLLLLRRRWWRSGWHRLLLVLDLGVVAMLHVSVGEIVEGRWDLPHCRIDRFIRGRRLLPITTGIVRLSVV